jgi:hypothetical protein
MSPIKFVDVFKLAIQTGAKVLADQTPAALDNRIEAGWAFKEAVDRVMSTLLTIEAMWNRGNHKDVRVNTFISICSY